MTSGRSRINFGSMKNEDRLPHRNQPGCPTRRESLIEVPDDAHLGPAMRALPETQRRFVVAFLETGGTNATKAAALAGYGSSDASQRVAGHRLSHNPRVAAAIKEEADKRLRTGAILGASVLIEIAQNPTHKDRFKAAVELLNRGGLIVQTEHKVTVVDERSDKEIEDRVVALAGKLGIDPKKLLGAAFSGREADVIEAEYEEVGTSDGLEDLL